MSGVDDANVNHEIRCCICLALKEDLEASPEIPKTARSHRRQRSTVRLEDPYQHGVEALVRSYSADSKLLLFVRVADIASCRFDFGQEYYTVATQQLQA